MASGRTLENIWRVPELVYGPNESELRDHIFDKWCQLVPVSDWTNHFELVDDILKSIISKFQQIACQKFKGLNIDKNFLKQASGRQGLKLNRAGDFDILLPFQFEGLELEKVHIKDSNNDLLTGYIKIRVKNINDLHASVPEMKRLDVFVMDRGTCYIHNENLQKKVFQSLIDKAIAMTKDRLMEQNGCVITRGTRPPTFDITVEFPHKECCSFKIDVVPGLLLGSETIEIPENAIIDYESMHVAFPMFAVMKWVSKETEDFRDVDKPFRWRYCSLGHEFYMFDMCYAKRERRYIMTSCRIMKAVVQELREKNNQAAILLSSYHLKTIAMYMILLLTVPGVVRSAEVKLSGVKESLSYFLRFLEIVLTEKKLPDFFLGNDFLQHVFPGSYFVNVRIQQDLFKKETPGLVDNAMHCFREIESCLVGCYSYDMLNDRVVQSFKSRILRL